AVDFGAPPPSARAGTPAIYGAEGRRSGAAVKRLRLKRLFWGPRYFRRGPLDARDHPPACPAWGWGWQLRVHHRNFPPPLRFPSSLMAAATSTRPLRRRY